MKFILLPVFSLFLLSGCEDESQHLTSNENLHSLILGMEVFQEGENVKLKSSIIDAEARAVVKLNKSPFLLSLPIYADNDVFQVCIWTDDSIFKKVRVGLHTDEVSFYSPGSGIAAERRPSSTIYIDNIAHNYLYNSRLIKLETNRHGISISTLGLNSKEYSITQQNGPLYAVIFTDLSKDKIIDKDELEYFVFEF